MGKICNREFASGHIWIGKSATADKNMAAMAHQFAPGEASNATLLRQREQL
jgi:hypothetical protein